MAFTHLINCLLLVYAPFFVLYKAKNLSEYRAYGICIMSALASLLTSFCKIFLMATFSVSLPETTSSEAVLDFTQYAFNMVDCYGMYILQKQKLTQIGDPQVRVLSMAIGWTFSETTLMHLFSLIPHATQDEFNEVFILRSLYSNLELVFLLVKAKFENIIVVALVLTLAKMLRREGSSLLKIVDIPLLFFFRCAIIPSLVNFLSQVPRNSYTPEQLGYKAVLSTGFFVVGRSFIKL